MQVIVKRSKLFHRIRAVEGILTEDAAGNKVSPEVEERFYAPATPDVQTIPDWCSDTLTFRVGVVDKSIIDIRPTAGLPAEVTAQGKADSPDVDSPADADSDKPAAADKAANKKNGK